MQEVSQQGGKGHSVHPNMGEVAVNPEADREGSAARLPASSGIFSKRKEKV